MVLSSFHTHTCFCDGEDSVETLCEKAAEKGFTALGFSSHAPLPSGLVSGWHMKAGDLGRYIDEVRAARKKWAGRLEVFLGLEVDYIRGVMGPADSIYKKLGFDYLIGSVHYVVPRRGAPFAVDGPASEFEEGIREGYGGNGEALMEAYWDAVRELCEAGGARIAGHLDLLKKNNQDERWFSLHNARYKEKLGQVLDVIAGSGMIVEVNTGGINRNKTKEVYPAPWILKDTRERGIPVLISSDAHRHIQLDGGYAEAGKILLEAGYTTIKRLSACGGRGPLWIDDPLE
ncbi:MAG: histidinol-phosphatase [Spirochaetaceae bacterium]|nr:histidinol-phosphatase [Spirochaetaceae bacterium]